MVESQPAFQGPQATCRVRLFARLKERVGHAEVCIPVGPGSQVDSVWQELAQRFPQIDSERARLQPVRNLAMARWSDPVNAGDVLSFLAPVSGGIWQPLISLSDMAIDSRDLERAVCHPGCGALVTFAGMVRDNSQGLPVRALYYEAYRELALRHMGAIADELLRRWPQARVAMAHRTGHMEIGEVAVVVSVSAPHRPEAFEACRFGIDAIKAQAPIWKKEFYSDAAAWIEADSVQTIPDQDR